MPSKNDKNTKKHGLSEENCVTSSLELEKENGKIILNYKHSNLGMNCSLGKGGRLETSRLNGTFLPSIL